MAAHRLTTTACRWPARGREAASHRAELRSMQWPLRSRAGGDEPGVAHSRSTSTRSASRRTPRARRSSTSTRTSGMVGPDYVKNITWREGSPLQPGPTSLVRARCWGARPTSWGRLALRLSTRLQGSPTTATRDWPISHTRCGAYYDKVDLYLASGVKENLRTCRTAVSASLELNVGEVKLRASLRRGEQVLTPFGAASPRRLKHNSIAASVTGGAPAIGGPAGRHPRRVRFAHG